MSGAKLLLFLVKSPCPDSKVPHASGLLQCEGFGGVMSRRMGSMEQACPPEL